MYVSEHDCIISWIRSPKSCHRHECICVRSYSSSSLLSTFNIATRQKVVGVDCDWANLGYTNNPHIYVCICIYAMYTTRTNMQSRRPTLIASLSVGSSKICPRIQRIRCGAGCDRGCMGESVGGKGVFWLWQCCSMFLWPRGRCRCTTTLTMFAKVCVPCARACVCHCTLFHTPMSSLSRMRVWLFWFFWPTAARTAARTQSPDLFLRGLLTPRFGFCFVVWGGYD